jgi:acyl dehydratase
MIEKKWIGHELAPATLPLDRRRLQFFAKAIGETDPVYSDVTAAQAAGYPDIPVPPTFLFAAELDSGVFDQMLAELGIPIGKLLHGEQEFVYLRPVFAGESVTVQSVISDIYDKKNGALEFVVKTSRATNQQGDLVAELRSVLVCRH